MIVVPKLRAVRSFTAVLALVLVCTFAAGVTAVRGQTANRNFVEPQNLKDLVAAAKAEGGTVTLSWADNLYGGTDGAHKLQELISKKFGIPFTIEFSPLAIPGGAFESQIAQEVKAGQPATSDILFNVFGVPEAAYMQSVDWRRYVPQFPADAMYFDMRSVALITVFEGFDYNTKLIPAADVPKKLDDLLLPKWKGKIATSPYQGIEGSYLGLPEALGHDGVAKFYTALSKQLGGLLRCGVMDRVASGEFLIFGIDCGDYAARLAQRSGMPIGVFYPKEGAGLYFLAPGIPKTAPHPYSARLVLAYLLSREGQNFLWDVTGSDNWKLPGSHMAAIVAEQRRKGVKIIEAYGADVAHPELDQYEKLIDQLVNTAK